MPVNNAFDGMGMGDADRAAESMGYDGGADDIMTS